MGKNKKIFVCISIVFVVVTIFYFSLSVNLEKKFLNSRNISIAKTVADINADETYVLSNLVLTPEMNTKFVESLDDFMIYYGWQENNNEYLPYYPFTMYQLAIPIEGDKTCFLLVYENGEIKFEDKSYFSFDGKKLFQLVDEIYSLSE